MVSNTPLIIYVLLQLKRQLFPPINWTITINDIIPMCVDHILPRLVQVVKRTTVDRELNVYTRTVTSWFPA